MTGVILDPYQNIVGVGWGNKPPDKTYLTFLTEVVDALYNPAISGSWPQTQVAFDTFTGPGQPLTNHSLTYFGGQFLLGALSWGFHQSDGQGIELQTTHWIETNLYDADGRPRGFGNDALLSVGSGPSLPAYGTGQGNFLGYEIAYAPAGFSGGGFQSTSAWMFDQGTLVSGLPGTDLNRAWDLPDGFGRGSQHWKQGPPRIMWMAPPYGGAQPQPYNPGYPGNVPSASLKTVGADGANYGYSDAGAACILDMSVGGVTYDGHAYTVIGYVTTFHIDPLRQRLRILCRKT